MNTMVYFLDLVLMKLRELDTLVKPVWWHWWKWSNQYYKPYCSKAIELVEAAAAWKVVKDGGAVQDYSESIDLMFADGVDVGEKALAFRMWEYYSLKKKLSVPGDIRFHGEDWEKASRLVEAVLMLVGLREKTSVRPT